MNGPALQTHFNSEPYGGRDTLAELRGLGVRTCRMDCMQTSIPEMQRLIADVESVGLGALPIVEDFDRLAALPNRDVEWTNEPDGDIWPWNYRPILDEACRVAREKNIRLWAPAISNLDRNSLLWLEALRGNGWPAGLHGISFHRYGDGTFEHPHDGFDSRDEEVETLRRIADGLPVICTEFGYPTDAVGRGRGRSQISTRLTEEDQAERVTKEWDFWARHRIPATLYQIDDGPDPTNLGDHYGIRRYADRSWKPAAYVFPKEDPMAELAKITPNTVFAKEDLTEVPGRPGEYGLRCPPGAQTILSPRVDGRHELRDLSALGGPNETCRVSGDLVYFWQNTDGGRFAWRLADAE